MKLEKLCESIHNGISLKEEANINFSNEISKFGGTEIFNFEIAKNSHNEQYYDSSIDKLKRIFYNLPINCVPYILTRNGKGHYFYRDEAYEFLKNAIDRFEIIFIRFDDKGRLLVKSIFNNFFIDIINDMSREEILKAGVYPNYNLIKRLKPLGNYISFN